MTDNFLYKLKLESLSYDTLNKMKNSSSKGNYKGKISSFIRYAKRKSDLVCNFFVKKMLNLKIFRCINEYTWPSTYTWMSIYDYVYLHLSMQVFLKACKLYPD